MCTPRAKQQNLEEKQADVEYELRCLLNKPGEGPVFTRPSRNYLLLLSNYQSAIINYVLLFD